MNCCCCWNDDDDGVERVEWRSRSKGTEYFDFAFSSVYPTPCDATVVNNGLIYSFQDKFLIQHYEFYAGQRCQRSMTNDQSWERRTLFCMVLVSHDQSNVAWGAVRCWTRWRSA